MVSTGPLLFNEDDPADTPVTVCADAEWALVELTVHGRWSRRLQVEATRAINKCFAECPGAVIVDLGPLEDPAAASASTWWAAAMRGAEREPAVQVALIVPPTAALATRLHRLGAKYYLPVYAGMAEARAAVHSRLPLTERHRLRLRSGPEAAAAGRDAVDAVCAAWALPGLRFPGRLVISELLNNAVTHAVTRADPGVVPRAGPGAASRTGPGAVPRAGLDGDTRDGSDADASGGADVVPQSVRRAVPGCADADAKITVILTRRGNGLHLAVCDGDPRLPRLLERASSRPDARWEDPGLGLRTVHRVATIWGAMPTATGKVV